MCPDRSKSVPKASSGRVSTPAQRLSDATFRALIENSNDAIVLFDSAWNIIYASPATERLLGYTPAEIVRIPALDLAHPDDVTLIRILFEECLAQPGKPLRAVARVRHKNGSWRWILAQADLLKDGQGRPIHMVGSHIDITELQQGEQEPFIAEVLKAADAEKLADLLAERIPADKANAKLLAKFLKRIVVKVVRLQDLRPSKGTLEKADIETVVGEFRKFLETAVNVDGSNQSTILEIK